MPLWSCFSQSSAWPYPSLFVSYPAASQGLIPTKKTIGRCHDKTCQLGFPPGPTQTRLYSQRRRLRALNFGFRKQRGCTIYVAKTKALISCTVAVQLIYAIVLAYAKSRFSNEVAQMHSYVTHPTMGFAPSED